MFFGVVFTLLLVGSVLAVPGVGLAVWLSTRGRRGSVPLTLASAAAPVVLFVALGAAFFSPWWLSQGQDWDTGSFDTFRTPLGGGFFATSVDSFKEVGLLEASDRSTLPPGVPGNITRLGCWNGITFLELNSGGLYVLVRADERKLETFPTTPRLAAALGVPVGSALPWTNRSGFSSTTCPPTAPTLASTLGLGVLLGLPLLVLAAGLGLVLWFVRVRRSPVESPPAHDEW